jgi:hypothetical protein
MDPHIVQFRLENAGKRDVPSSVFDKGSPLQFDFGVKIVAVLHASHRPVSMLVENLVPQEKVLNIGPCLIPRGGIIEYVLLVEGACAGVVCRSPLEEVQVKEKIRGKEDTGRWLISLRQWVTYAMVAFAIWWVMQDPENAARLVHSIGSALSSAATGMANFISAI